MLVYCSDHGMLWRTAKRCPICGGSVVPVPLVRLVLIVSGAIVLAALLVGVVGPYIQRTALERKAEAAATEMQSAEAVVAASQYELLERDLKVWRLYTCYNETGNRIQVSGKLFCGRGRWKSVTLGFVFRGPNNCISHEQHYAVPAVSEATPLRPGIVKEFAFEIPKFPRPWEEHHVSFWIKDAVPVE